ncbi:MAG: dihydroorotase [Wenzhouxiangellaceae bacterium]
MTTYAPPTLIRNALIVTDGQRLTGDVLIRNGRIEQLGGDLKAPAGASEFDAAGRALIPGMIDDQVHFREPGLTHKGDIATESRAAVAGGITSFMEMPNTQPPTVTREALADKYARADGRARANYAFYLGATNDNIDEIRALKADEAAGVKVFMGSSTGNMLVDREETLDLIFRDAPGIITTHCEDTPTINDNLEAARQRYGDAIPIEAHPEIRSVEACYRSSSLAIELARRHHSQLHILHLTTAKEMGHFESGPISDKHITAEVCVHHLHYSADDYSRLGNQIKCNPAVKSAADRAALIKALAEDRLDIIATDHAPHTWEEKTPAQYTRAAAGLPLVQHALPLALELVHDGHLTLEQLITKTSHNVALRYQVRDRGHIREGYWADLALIDLQSPWKVDADQLLYHCGWSPLTGSTLRSRVAATWVNGELMWDGQRAATSAPGRRLEFDRGS